MGKDYSLKTCSLKAMETDEFPRAAQQYAFTDV